MNQQGQYRPGGFGILPPVVKNLLIINGLMFLATIILNINYGIDLRDLLGLHYPFSQAFEPYQLITYMFMHGNFTHILFNMFAVWMFGTAVENVWGGRRFLTYYLITGLGAAFLHYLVVYFQIQPDVAQINAFLDSPSLQKLESFISNHEFAVNQHIAPELNVMFTKFKDAYDTLQYYPDNTEAMNYAIKFMSEYKEHYKSMHNVVGASGSLFGILLAFGMMFPNAELFLIFLPIPIKAKYFVIGYGLIELFSGLANTGSNVAHFAHVGGMVFGFILIKFWQHTKGKYY